MSVYDNAEIRNRLVMAFPRLFAHIIGSPAAKGSTRSATPTSDWTAWRPNGI